MNNEPKPQGAIEGTMGQSHSTAGLGKPLAEVNNVDWLRQEVQRLWDLLDDIDTASDIAKGNDEWYRRRVEHLQAKRFDSVTSDGYGLFAVLPGMEV